MFGRTPAAAATAPLLLPSAAALLVATAAAVAASVEASAKATRSVHFSSHFNQEQLQATPPVASHRWCWPWLNQQAAHSALMSVFLRPGIMITHWDVYESLALWPMPVVHRCVRGGTLCKGLQLGRTTM